MDLLHFIAELFDLNHDSDQYIENGQLNYISIYTNKRIINGLLFSWVYRNIFKIYPSKLDICTEFEDLNTIKTFLEKNTFARFMNYDVSNEAFTFYKKSLTDIAICKEELYIKLKNRLPGLVVAAYYDPHLTLFKQFDFSKINYKNESFKIQNCKCNPFSKQIPLGIYKVNDSMVITFIDYILHIITRDFCFLSKIYNKQVLIGCKFNLQGFFTISETEYIEYIPKIAAICVSLNTITLANKQNTNFLEHDVPEFLIPAYLKQNQNIPLEIQKIMWMKYKSLDLEKIKMNILKDSKNCVLLVDNRKNMLSVLAAFITFSNLQTQSWSLIIATRKENESWYTSHLGKNVRFINHDLLEINPFNIELYNSILKDCEFWKDIGKLSSNKCIVIQDDGFIIRPGAEEFMIFDWVGAPWPKSQNLIDVGVTSFVGNGGLSLRSIPSMINITSDLESCKHLLFNMNMQPIPEDVYFSIEMVKHGYLLPSESKANSFSSEMILNKDAIGIHKPWGYFPLNDVIELFFKN